MKKNSSVTPYKMERSRGDDRHTSEKDEEETAINRLKKRSKVRLKQAGSNQIEAHIVL